MIPAREDVYLRRVLPFSLPGAPSMNNLSGQSIRLFQFSGITVFLHWSWFLVAFYQIYYRSGRYTAPAWMVLEYLSLFAIVLLHEFGHALACRQVGGKAEQIVLWPLGGVAFVSPPPRPGAVLWSIAAGPLVNLLLAPILFGAWYLTAAGFLPVGEDAQTYIEIVAIINAGLFIFNMMPVYPLDGGQILQALLWFWLGRARSLQVVSYIGIAGAIGLVVLALGVTTDIWLVVIAGFIAWQAWNGLMRARALSQPGVDSLVTGLDFMGRRDFAAAIAAFTQAIASRPEPQSLALAYVNRAAAYVESGNADAAIADSTEAMRLAPDQGVAFMIRGMAHGLKGEPQKALADYDEAVRFDPKSPGLYVNRGMIHGRLGAYADARADYLEAIRLDPEAAIAFNNLAWLLATCPRDELRDGPQALAYARRACELTQGQVATCLATLGAAHAEVGDFYEASKWQGKALEDEAYRRQYEEDARQRLQQYAAGQAYRAG